MAALTAPSVRSDCHSSLRLLAVERARSGAQVEAGGDVADLQHSVGYGRVRGWAGSWCRTRGRARGALACGHECDQEDEDWESTHEGRTLN